MTFIITLVALLVERFFDWSHLRRWQWYYNYQHAIMKRLAGSGALLILAACVLPLMIMAFIIDYLFSNALFGIFAGVFQLLVLLYCLGPQNFWADSFAAINALVHGDPKLAAEKLKISFSVSDMGSAQAAHWQLLRNMFYAAEIRVFGVVFWFVILGPAGALMYRCVTASALLNQDVPDTEYMQHVRSIHDLIDWIPARIFTVMFALGGHFAKVISSWKNNKNSCAC